MLHTRSWRISVSLIFGECVFKCEAFWDSTVDKSIVGMCVCVRVCVVCMCTCVYVVCMCTCVYFMFMSMY